MKEVRSNIKECLLMLATFALILGVVGGVAVALGYYFGTGWAFFALLIPFMINLIGLRISSVCKQCGDRMKPTRCVRDLEGSGYILEHEYHCSRCSNLVWLDL